MKLVSFSTADGKIRPGSLLEEAGLVVDLTAAGFADTTAVLSAGFTSVAKPAAYPAYKLSDVRLHAPIANPPRVFAIGLNYREHAIESKLALPKFPVVFFKMSTAIVGPGENIVLPKNSTQPDYEAELAFVIGKGGYRIPASAWHEHVYGYTIVNDVSARDIQLSTSQWSLAKSFPTFCPMGPAIVTIDEIADPHQLAISLSIDGEVLQNSTTSELVFNIPGTRRVHLLHHAPAPWRRRIHRHSIRRRHGPHPATLAQTWRICNRQRRRPRLSDQSRRRRVIGSRNSIAADSANPAIPTTATSCLWRGKAAPGCTARTWACAHRIPAGHDG